ncbi:MAG TPA: nicotinate (nicotinamide) nucleotide adenylyltransferase [Candidatus Saccharimonadales bacterium]|nr:nicotinate (nicotinamide) nucleotide adenylyltransferase [Candidatus Saccharimonadales bacterium]
MDKSPRIGIYGGTFDPVHAGHISFALQAITEAKLDKVVFLPERQPWHKSPKEHYAHRVAMIKRAIRPYENMSVMELPDKKFTIKRTLPSLQKKLKSENLVMLVGSDVLINMPEWSNFDILMAETELFVGTRADDDPHDIKKIIKTWEFQPQKLHIVRSQDPHVSSSKVRSAIAKQTQAHGLLQSVQAYAKDNWLYVSIEHAVKNKGDRADS